MKKDELFSLKIPKPDDEIRRLCRKKWDELAKPIDGLGDLEEIICSIASIQKSVNPDISKKALLVMCADNGITDEGVTQTDRKTTFDVATLMGERRSSVGAMTGDYPIDIFAYDVGVDSEDTPEGVINKKIRRGTSDFLEESAMNDEQCMAAIEVGIDAVRQLCDRGYKIIATGEMGIGNTTTATALLCALTGASVKECTGRGSGLTDEGLGRKIEVIEKGLNLYADKTQVSSPGDVFEVLRNLGGLDIAALAGVFIGGALYSVPIVIDGLISGVAALVAERIIPGCRDFMIASHKGKEKGCDIILRKLALNPVISANLALGEGTGAVLLFPMLDMALSLYKNGTAFSQTPIGQYERFDK
jgi:nicotinate-nucleotide--dimethylbenzimidazole phosphoribosyltransferase